MNQTPHEVVRVVGVALLAMGKKSIFDEATKQISGEIWQPKTAKILTCKGECKHNFNIFSKKSRVWN